jgi:hypothetical protein
MKADGEVLSCMNNWNLFIGVNTLWLAASSGKLIDGVGSTAKRIPVWGWFDCAGSPRRDDDGAFGKVESVTR